MDKYAGGEMMSLQIANAFVAERSTSARFRARWNKAFRQKGKTEIAW